MTTCSDLRTAVVILSVLVAILTVTLFVYIVVRDRKFFRELFSKALRKQQANLVHVGKGKEHVQEDDEQLCDISEDETAKAHTKDNQILAIDNSNDEVIVSEAPEHKTFENTRAKNVYIDMTYHSQKSNLSVSTETDTVTENVMSDTKEETDSLSSDDYENTCSRLTVQQERLSGDASTVNEEEDLDADNMMGIQKNHFSNDLRNSSPDAIYTNEPGTESLSELQGEFISRQFDGQSVESNTGANTDDQAEDDLYIPMSATDKDEQIYDPLESEQRDRNSQELVQDDIYEPMSRIYGNVEESESNTVTTAL